MDKLHSSEHLIEKVWGSYPYYYCLGVAFFISIDRQTLLILIVVGGLPFTNKFEMTVESNTYISPMGSHASASWVNRLCFSHKVRVRLLVATLVDKSVYFHLQFGTQCSCVPIHSNGRYLHRSAKFFLRLHLCCRKVGAAQKSVPFRTMQCDVNLELRLDMGVLWC